MLVFLKGHRIRNSFHDFFNKKYYIRYIYIYSRYIINLQIILPPQFTNIQRLSFDKQ